MSEPDYKAFYDAIIGVAEGLQFLTEKSAENFTLAEHNIMKIVAQNIVFAADQYVPGGLHTEVFNINHKEH